MYITVPCCHNNLHQPINLQFPLFIATVLTNKLIILTILFLQCKNTVELALLYCSIDIDE